MKNLHFIIQSKGGVGKSCLSYLIALLEESNQKSLFIDIDSSTKTSTRQLQFLDDSRLETISLLDDRGVLIRDRLVSILEDLTDSPFTDIYFDFGAPESEQFPALIERDLLFKEFCDELDYKAFFHVVVAGGGAYPSSIKYLVKMLEVSQNQIPIIVWENKTSFRNLEKNSSDLKQNCERYKLKLKSFGDFEPTTLLGGQILNGISKGLGLNEYPIGAKMRLKKELSTLKF
jgi:hypothetical protein